MMFILEVPEGLDVTEGPKDIQAAIKSVSGQWPEAIMPGTAAAGGRQLVLVYADATKAELESLIASFSLTWQVLACDSEPVNQLALIPFFLDIVTIAEDGTETSEPVTDLTGKLQTFAGKNWIFE